MDGLPVNFRPEPRTLFVVLAETVWDPGSYERAGSYAHNRREYLVMGWTERDGQIVPVVAEENTAKTHVLSPKELEDSFYVIPPTAVYLAENVDRPLWLDDFTGIARSAP